jgi:magnesium chelatase family protein
MKTATIIGLKAASVDVEVAVVGSFPAFDIVGLPEQSVRETRVRVRSAIREAGFPFPDRRVIANLAPAGVEKDGCAMDLALALGILEQTGVVTMELGDMLVFGELSLTGQLRPVRGATAMALLAKERGWGIICPAQNAREVAIVGGVQVWTASTLAELVERMEGGEERWFDSAYTLGPAHPADRGREPCWSDVRGQEGAKRALEIAVVGGFSVKLNGCPGTGKTMLARRLPTIMPMMDPDEVVETTNILSVAGLLGQGASPTMQRPFRAPHHTCSTTALVGGGQRWRPGELTLATNGILLLDEIAEFPAASIAAIKDSLERKQLLVGRGREPSVIPVKTLVVVGSNPCPCGWKDSALHRCSCSEKACETYALRASRLPTDIEVSLAPLPPRMLRDMARGQTSAEVRDRIVEAMARTMPEWEQDAAERLNNTFHGNGRLRAVAIAIARLDGVPVHHGAVIEAAALCGLLNDAVIAAASGQE